VADARWQLEPPADGTCDYIYAKGGATPIEEIATTGPSPAVDLLVVRRRRGQIAEQEPSCHFVAAASGAAVGTIASSRMMQRLEATFTGQRLPSGDWQLTIQAALTTVPAAGFATNETAGSVVGKSPSSP